MMKDRFQKQKLIQYFLSRQWYPQMEVEIYWPENSDEKHKMITDIDVLGLAPKQNGKTGLVIGDCKTLKSQSPVNRAFWLKGLMEYLNAEYGIVLLSKRIDHEHKLLANSLDISLLSEDDFKLYSSATLSRPSLDAELCDLNRWDKYFSLYTFFPALSPLLDYCRKDFWNERDSTVQIRHSIAKLQNARTEMNPQKGECCFLFLEACSMFSAALCDICINTFEKFLWQKDKESFERDLRMQLWGGFETYQFWDQLRRRLLSKNPNDSVAPLTLPEWASFIQLVRSCMDSPLELSIASIILKELGFHYLQDQISIDNYSPYLKEIIKAHPYAAKCSVLQIDYIVKATKMPMEFSDSLIGDIMKIQRVS